MCVLQFKQAARQVDADEIADVLEEQAADAEDAAAAEEGLDAEAAAAVKASAAGDHLLVDVKASKSAPVINAEGATKDVHEADLDMSHADSAPGMIICLNLSPSRVDSGVNFLQLISFANAPAWPGLKHAKVADHTPQLLVACSLMHAMFFFVQQATVCSQM